MSTLLEHLEALVGFDTRNPPRLIGTGGIFDYLQAQLPGFRCTVTDHGDGAVSLLAVRGTPTRVFNVHLDTVPSSEAWSADPLTLRVADGRAIGADLIEKHGVVGTAQRGIGTVHGLFVAFANLFAQGVEVLGNSGLSGERR